MDDLVTRLRGLARCEHSDHSIGDKAADRIEAQAAEIARLKAQSEKLADGIAYALDGVIAAFPSYRARNGKSVSLQAEDGEKCWIIHDDVRNDVIQARAALAQHRGK